MIYYMITCISGVVSMETVEQEKALLTIYVELTELIQVVACNGAESDRPKYSIQYRCNKWSMCGSPQVCDWTYI